MHVSQFIFKLKQILRKTHWNHRCFSYKMYTIIKKLTGETSMVKRPSIVHSINTKTFTRLAHGYKTHKNKNYFFIVTHIFYDKKEF